MIGATDVFVSYKAEDRRRVVPLVQALEAEGFSVWWDARIDGGSNWHRDIEQHLESAKCVVVAWTKRSAGDDGHFVREEARRAQRRGVYLPVCLDSVEPPLGFGEIQALPLKGWKGDSSDSRFRQLAEAVRRRITGEGIPLTAIAYTRSGASRRAVLAGGAGALALTGLGSWLMLRPARTKANTIAVLPFANLSGDPSQNYFSDGMAEEVRSALATINGIEVVARTSSELLRNADAITAARRLSVANVVTGSVRRSTDTVRVSAQLIDGKDGLERWSRSFDRPFGDALAIQSEIATNVARALSIELGEKGLAVGSSGGTRNAQAQDLLLQATAARDRDDSERGTLATVALLDRAIELDPRYAEAYARKARYLDLWAIQFPTSVADKERGQSEAIQSAQRAVQLAPEMPLGYAALAVIHLDQLQIKRALSEFQKAEALPGSDAVTLATYSVGLCQSRRQGQALSTIARAIRLDPLNAFVAELQSLIYFYGRRFAESMASARRALRLEPERIRATGLLASALLFSGRRDEALKEFQKMPAEARRRLLGEAAIAARSGQREGALDALRTLRQRYGETAYYQFAQIYAQLGMVAEAIAALESAWDKRDSWLGNIQVDPFLDPLRRDPELSAIAARVFG